MELKTKYAIGDLVYTANKYDVDRDVIKAIKVLGIGQKVEYGIKSKSSGSIWALSFYSGGDGFKWYKPSEIYEQKEDAQAHHENLKAKAEAEEAKEEAAKKKERKAELEEQLRELEEE